MTNFSNIYELQRKLDEVIFAEHNLSYDATFDKRVLALVVELSELANEIREFKFWSKKSASANEVIFEEYIDGIHFLTSLGISINIDVNHECNSKVITQNQTTYFLKLNEMVLNFAKTKSVEDYLELFEAYIGFGQLIGLDLEELQRVYLLKNDENHARQENNY